MSSQAADILDQLKALGNSKDVAGMAHFGIRVEKAFGVRVSTLRKMAKEIGRDHQLAEALWASGYHEARILACLVDEAGDISEAQMDAWIKDFDSWDLCDTCTGSLFDRHPQAYEKAMEWSQLESEFERRAGFAMMAWLALHDKKEADLRFEEFFPYIEAGSIDERNYVKKAVSWALRQIGKRNLGMRDKAIVLANTIHRLDSTSAKWIASDALRELNKATTIARLEKKAA